MFEEIPTGTLSFAIETIRVAQIMVNLLSNAIKFTDKCDIKQIVVSLEIASQKKDKVIVLVSVKDSGMTSARSLLNKTGVGMTLEEQSMIFNRFVQASANTYHEYGGSGLGLYICKGLVELMEERYM